MEHKKNFDLGNFRLLIAQIKLIEEDFCKSQLWLEIMTPTTISTKRDIHDITLLLAGRARDIVSQQSRGAKAMI